MSEGVSSKVSFALQWDANNALTIYKGRKSLRFSPDAARCLRKALKKPPKRTASASREKRFTPPPMPKQYFGDNYKLNGCTLEVEITEKGQIIIRVYPPKQRRICESVFCGNSPAKALSELRRYFRRVQTLDVV